MEPSEFDQLIKSKLEDKTSLHEHEMEAAKPFVWGAILNNISKRHYLRWYHLAAAVVLLLVGFSIVFYQMENRHENEMSMLSSRMDQVIQQYEIQAVQLSSKNKQVLKLESKLKNVEETLAQNNDGNLYGSNYKIIHQTDTVYIRQVEYVTKIEKTIDESDKVQDLENVSTIQQDSQPENKSVADMPIFLTQAKKKKDASGETMQVKFGTFVKGE